MLLSYTDLHELIADGVIDADPQYVNSSSIDVHLGHSIQVESDMQHGRRIIDLARKELPLMRVVQLDGEGYVMHPGEFILAHTKERFNMPLDVSAEFKLRSSVARAGVNHSLAGWCDPGWHDAHLTLELHNALTHHPVRLRPGMRIGQMVFYRHTEVPADRSYRVRGRYNNVEGVSRHAV